MLLDLCACLFASVSHSLSRSLFLVIVFLLDYSILDSLHRKYAQSFTASTKSRYWCSGQGKRAVKSEGRQKEGWGGFFFISKGAAFPKVPGATLQHLGSPRPFGCLLIANPHLCHMAR